MFNEGEDERRGDLRERVFALLTDLVQLRSYACQDLGRAHNVGAKFVHVGFAGAFDLGDVCALVAAGTGKGVEVALDAGLHAPAARFD
jgi:hypothetical protein